MGIATEETQRTQGGPFRYCGGGTATTGGQLVTLGAGMVTGQNTTDPGCIYLELDPNAASSITYGVSGATSTTMYPGSPPLTVALRDPSAFYITNAGNVSITWALYR